MAAMDISTESIEEEEEGDNVALQLPQDEDIVVEEVPVVQDEEDEVVSTNVTFGSLPIVRRRPIRVIFINKRCLAENVQKRRLSGQR